MFQVDCQQLAKKASNAKVPKMHYQGRMDHFLSMLS